jgi:beta-galactosidase
MIDSIPRWLAQLVCPPQGNPPQDAESHSKHWLERRTLLAAGTLLALCAFSLPAARGDDAQRSLDSGWRFQRGDVPGAEAPDFEDKSWRTVDLPHDWSVEDLPPGEGVTGPHDRKTPDGSSVGYLRGGTGWYRQRLTDAQRPAGDGLELIMHGAQQECDIWVNGTHVAFQPHGYIPARVEIGRCLRPRPQTNVIAIRVTNPESNSRWYSGSGLYRGVSLRGHDDLYIPTWGARVNTTWLEGARAETQMQVEVRNDHPTAPRDAEVEVELTAPDGSASRHSLGHLRLAPATTERLNASVPLKAVKPWTPETPQLYRARFRLLLDGRVLDEYATRFGVRTVAVSPERGLLLNGMPIKLRGGCLHHDNGLLGARAFPDAEKRRVRLVKENGFNAIRTSHNPPSAAFLEACDEEGILVIDEFADSWQLPKKRNGYQRYFDAHAERDLATMLARDFNHPSVIIWSIGNEIPERFSPTGVVIGQRLADLVRREDPRRPVTNAISVIWENPSLKGRWEANDPAFPFLDVGGYNYMWEKYESDHARQPQRVMVGAESYPIEAWENWQAVETLPYVIGDFVWTAMDHLGESGIGHTGYVNADAVIRKQMDASQKPWPVWINWSGDIDLIGNKKPQSLYRDVVWRRSPLEILVHEPIPDGKKEKVGSWGWPAELPTWNWPGQEGKPLQVSVYTRARRVRLALDGRVIGEQDVDPAKGIAARFTVPWAAGTLTATALDGDAAVATKELRTTGPAAQIRLLPETAPRRADRAALVFVPIEALDSAGSLVSDAALPLSIKVEGEAELCAFGSADPEAVGPLADATAKTFRGRALTILRSTGNAGMVRLQVTAPGLSPATAELSFIP